MKGTDALIETMLKHGTKVTFGYPGGSVIPLFDAFLEYEGRIKNLLVRHEQGAAHAADAFGRVLGRPGVCIATSGPGASNLVTGIMTAYMDSSPLIAMGGQVKVSLIGNDAFQETDMMGITLPITKHSFQPRSPDEIAPVLMKAYKLASEGRPGPVYIDLPSDVQSGNVTKAIPKEVRIESFRPNVRPHPNQIKRAAELIINAERPLFLIGGGVISANASRELKELVHLVQAPVATTLMGKGAFDEYDPLSIGVAGMHGRKIANYAVINCDLMIVIGCRLIDRVTGSLRTFAENCRVIQIDIDPAEIGKNVKPDLPIVGDAKLAISDLTKAIRGMAKKGKNTEWEKRISELRELCFCNLDRDCVPVSPIRVVGELMKALKESDIVCTGVGQHQMFCAHFMRVRHPRTFISSGGAGTMGFGLPAAMGAKVARPDAEVFDVDGDGSFQMTIQELGTCAAEGIKINPVIMSNHYLGMVRQWLEIYFNKRYSQVSLGKNPDFVKIAEAYGLRGANVTRPGEIAGALKEQIKSRETFVVNIELDPESNILPMLPPAGNIKDAFGGCMKAPGRFF
jgi:acetolactate synthase-1/2/3 large subunit